MSKYDGGESEQERQLWTNWVQHRQSQHRQALFFCYLPWAREQARYIYVRYNHPLAEWQDYTNLASLALLQAIDRFDPGQSSRFQAFAGRYIKGGILRGLSCYVSDQRAQTHDDRDADADSGAHAAQVEALINIAVGGAFGYFLEMGIVEQSPVDNNPSSLYSADCVRQRLLQALEELPPRERQLMVLHYFQYRSFVEISALLGVNKSRVTQIHQRALKRIRARFRGSEH